MNWIILIIAGLFEVAFATCLGKAKEASGSELPIGTAYAVWTGIGAVGTVFIGIFLFKEPATFWRLFFMTTLIASIVGLKIVSN